MSEHATKVSVSVDDLGRFASEPRVRISRFEAESFRTICSAWLPRESAKRLLDDVRGLVRPQDGHTFAVEVFGGYEIDWHLDGDEIEAFAASLDTTLLTLVAVAPMSEVGRHG